MQIVNTLKAEQIFTDAVWVMQVLKHKHLPNLTSIILNNDSKQLKKVRSLPQVAKNLIEKTIPVSNTIMWGIICHYSQKCVNSCLEYPKEGNAISYLGKPRKASQGGSVWIGF